MCWWVLVCSQIGTNKEPNPVCSVMLSSASFPIWHSFSSDCLTLNHIFYTLFYSPFLFSLTTCPIPSLLTHQSCHFERFWWLLSAVMILSLFYPISNCLKEDRDRSQWSLSITVIQAHGFWPCTTGRRSWVCLLYRSWLYLNVYDRLWFQANNKLRWCPAKCKSKGYLKFICQTTMCSLKLNSNMMLFVPLEW